MKIKSIRLIAVETVNSLKIFNDDSRLYAAWEIEPEFEIGLNDEDKYIQNIEISLIKTIGIQHASIKVLTSFEIELGDNEYIPKTDQEFLEYASLQQISIAHTRAFFLKEAMGTKFSGEIIPFDNLYNMLQKIKLATFLVKDNRLN